MDTITAIAATTKEWGRLFEAAAAFKKAACWDWMDNSHIFGIQHPDSEQIGYACILGRGGEMYGLAVYIGEAGLSTMIEMFNDELKGDLIHAQHCLMLSFDDREELHPSEKARIKELGLKFRGRQAWPTFRLYEPGYYPWPLETAPEVRFLTAAIEQAIEVSLAAKPDPDERLAPKSDRFFLTRVATPHPDGTTEWRTEWLEPVEVSSAILPIAIEINDLQLMKIKKAVRQRAGNWEISMFYLPTPIMEGIRPVFPMALMLVDQESGQIIGIELGDKTEMQQTAARKLLGILESMRKIPLKLFTDDETVFDMVLPVIKGLEIDCYIANSLPALEEAKEAIVAQMR